MQSNHRDRWTMRAAGRRGALGFGLVLLAVGCTTTPAPAPPVVYDAYVIGAPDELAVTVLPEPVVAEAVVVRPDGKITIQLIGDVQAAGRSPGEVGAEIEERIGRFKRGARATVSVVRALSSEVTVLGEVRSPGTFALAKKSRVVEALGRSAGTTNFANRDEIRILRSKGATTEVIEVDLVAIRRGDLTTNVQIEGGDVVYVPPILLAKIGYAVQALLFPLQPALGLATSAAGSAIVGF